MNREKYLDYAKGLAILCLLFSHTMDTSEYYMGSWITSFHMPIFFIIGGISHSLKWQSGTTIDDLTSLVRKRLFQLGVPYFVFCVLLTLFYAILAFISDSEFDFYSYVFKIFTLQGIDSLWFIPCYFISEILLTLSNLNKKTRWISILACGVMFIYLLICKDYSAQWLLRLALKILVCFSFMLVGYYGGQHKREFAMPIVADLLLIIIGIIGSIINGAVGIRALKFGNVVLFYLNAVITSCSIISLFHWIENKKIGLKPLAYFGRDSIVILCTNNLLIESIRLLDYKLPNNFLLNHAMIGCLAFTLILIVMETGIIALGKTKLGVVFGKKII